MGEEVQVVWHNDFIAFEYYACHVQVVDCGYTLASALHPVRYFSKWLPFSMIAICTKASVNQRMEPGL